MELGEREEGLGGAVRGGGVIVFGLFFEGVERSGEAIAEAIGGGVEELLAAMGQRGAEMGIAVTPVVEGAGVDVMGLGDDGEGGAGEKHVEGEELFVGQIGVVIVEIRKPPEIFGNGLVGGAVFGRGAGNGGRR